MWNGMPIKGNALVVKENERLYTFNLPIKTLNKRCS
jgi:hypothetical protein